VLDIDDVEELGFNAVGGNDNIIINNLAGTDVTQVNVELGVAGGGDGVADIVTVNGTLVADTFGITANAGVVSVAGLAAQIAINGSEAANDSLILNGLDGLDTFSIGPGVTSLIAVMTNQ